MTKNGVDFLQGADQQLPDAFGGNGKTAGDLGERGGILPLEPKTPLHDHALASVEGIQCALEFLVEFL